MMDNGHWRPTPQGGGGGGGSGQPTMEAGDWRAQLAQESRQRIVNKIMDTLKKHLPISGPDGLSELKKIAVRFEERIYTAATSQEDYLRKISLKMLTMETKSQNTIPNSLPPNPAGSSGKPPEQVPMDPVGQAGHANGSDWQEEVYQKIKSMKEMYLPEINELYQKIATKLQQHDSFPQQPKADLLERLKTFKTMLERIIYFLQVSKNDVLPTYKGKLALYERQIINLINSNRPRKTPALQGQVQQPGCSGKPPEQGPEKILHCNG